MPGLSKETSQRYREAALRLVDVVALDAITDVEVRRKNLRRLADALVAEVGCTLETARRHIAAVARIKRHPNFTGAGGYRAAGITPAWGGARPGAGRPKADESSEED